MAAPFRYTPRGFEARGAASMCGLLEKIHILCSETYFNQSEHPNLFIRVKEMYEFTLFHCTVWIGIMKLAMFLKMQLFDWSWMDPSMNSGSFVTSEMSFFLFLLHSLAKEGFAVHTRRGSRAWVQVRGTSVSSHVSSPLVPIHGAWEERE